jgi:hypothetical protein
LLAIHVLLLGLDLQLLLALPQWLWIKLEELLRSLFIRELDKYRSLEEFVITATKTNSISGTVRGKESFDIKLRAALLVTESLDIDGSSLSFGSGGGRIVWDLALDLFLALRASDFKEGRFAECCDDGGIWAEALHAPELADLGDRNWKVSATIGHIPHEFVGWQVGITKVEFDLCANCQFPKRAV